MRGSKFILLTGGKPSIVLSASSAVDSATVGTAVGTASIRGRTTGTASYSLTNDASGKYAINSSTGAVTVAGALTAGTDSITIAVSGLTPAVASRSFSITVTHVVSAAPMMRFNVAANSQLLAVIMDF